MKLLIASKNLHKVRECKTLLKEFARKNEIDLLSLREFPDYTPPEETGSTFEENARIKALHAAKLIDMLVLADDSGLVVPALNNAPGVYSARYAGIGATDSENRFKLLKEMSPLLDNQRTARYECCMVLANRDGVIKVAEGSCVGTILAKERGNQGFGYDPLFVKAEYNKTFAEIDEEMKNKISHRGKSITKILQTLESLVKSGNSPISY